MNGEGIPEDDVAVPDARDDFLDHRLREEPFSVGDGGDFKSVETLE